MTEDKTCIATTASGDSCSNPAQYPENEPKYCHIHWSDDTDETEPDAKPNENKEDNEETKANKESENERVKKIIHN